MKLLPRHIHVVEYSLIIKAVRLTLANEVTDKIYYIQLPVFNNTGLLLEVAHDIRMGTLELSKEGDQFALTVRNSEQKSLMRRAACKILTESEAVEVLL